MWIVNSHGVVGHDARREPRKLVPLEVNGPLENAKRAKKYFPMLEWGVPYTNLELKRRAFQQAKEHANQIPD